MWRSPHHHKLLHPLLPRTQCELICLHHQDLANTTSNPAVLACGAPSLAVPLACPDTIASVEHSQHQSDKPILGMLTLKATSTVDLIPLSTASKSSLSLYWGLEDVNLKFFPWAAHNILQGIKQTQGFNIRKECSQVQFYHTKSNSVTITWFRRHQQQKTV